jgi:hypothetical protein
MTRYSSNYVLRHGRWDALFLFLAFVHGCALIYAPSILLIAIGLWWNANTISHNFIHLPFFRRSEWNRLFSAYLTLILGIPQQLWRDRHLAHHTGKVFHLRNSNQLLGETAIVATLWISLLLLSPNFFAFTYLPGIVAGLGLCFLQGHFEHATGTTSHYGRLYNFLFFNDGFHAEHHAHPGRYWTDLPNTTVPRPRVSRWPAVLRWIEVFGLDSLEKAVVAFKPLQKFTIRCHERAFRKVLPLISPCQRIAIVGGGIHPRSALVLKKLIPDAEVTVIDADPEHLQIARGFLNGEVNYVHEFFDGGPVAFDVVVIPLAFRGDRRRIYRQPPAGVVVIHDWIWNRSSAGFDVSWLLLKRINVVRS